MTEPVSTPHSFLVEELEERFELASFAAQQEPLDPGDPEGCCSGSCCLGTDCPPWEVNGS